MIAPLIRRASVTAAALFSVLALSVSQASAAPIAYNTKTMWMLGTATPYVDPSCVYREIHLAAGNYGWAQTQGGQISAHRTIWLTAGEYSMHDCLNGADGYYKHFTYLIPPGNNPTVYYATSWDPETDGTYTWGSYLNPYF